MPSGIPSIHRRRFLQIASVPPCLVAGCLQTDGSNADETGSSTDDGSTDDANEDGYRPDHENRGDSDGEHYNGPHFEAEPAVDNEPTAEEPLEIDVTVDQREVSPSRVKLTVLNASDEEHTLAFDGFVPLPDPFGQHLEREDQLVLIPGADTPTPAHETYVTDEELRPGQYFTPLERVESPDSETTVDLASGESLDGTFYILEVPQSDEERPWGDGPYPGEYYFETNIDILSTDDVASISFGLFVDYVEV